MFGKEDEQSAISEADIHIQETRQVEVKLPVGVAYNLGMMMAITGGEEILSDSPSTFYELYERLAQVVPIELMQSGVKKYQGDSGEEVDLKISYQDIATIGNKALLMPKILESTRKLELEFAPEYQSVFKTEDRGYYFSVLHLNQRFVGAGGKDNIPLRQSLQKLVGLEEK